MAIENGISQQEAVSIPAECLVPGGVAKVTTNATIDGKRYLAGDVYCKRTPLLESQRPYEQCPAVKTCVLHKVASRVVLRIEADSQKEDKLKQLETQRNQAIANAMADAY
jgi:hypothetical protein